MTAGETAFSICEVTREWTTWVWLCERHERGRRARGWTVKRLPGPPVDSCTDCQLERQAAA